MNENNLIQYCKEHSIRFACRICNRTAPSKEEMQLVSPSDDIYGNIHYCQLSTIIKENSDIFLCETCCDVLYRCAYGIYHMKYGFVLYGARGTIRCRVCKSTIGVKQLSIEKETKKYEVLLLLVKASVDMPTWICNACNGVLEDLCDLHRTVAYTTLDIQTTLASEKALHAEKRVTSKPVAIPNPKPRLPVFQTSRDFENEEEAENDLSHRCLQDDELMFFMELEHVDTSKDKKSVDIFSTRPKSTIFQAAKDPQNLENKENVKNLFMPHTFLIEDDCSSIMEPQDINIAKKESGKVNTSSWGFDKNSDRFKTPTWSVLSNESHSDYGNLKDIQKMACSEFNNRSEIYKTLYNNTTTFTRDADQGSRTWPWLNNNMWPEMKKVKHSRLYPITPEIHDLFYSTSQWHNIQGEPLNYSDEGFYNELDINNSENEAFAEKLSSKKADKLNINNDDQAKVLYQAEFSAEKCDENGNEPKPLIQETVKKFVQS